MKSRINRPDSLLFVSYSSFVFLVFILLASACVTQRDVEYLQDDSTTIKEFQEAKIEDYRLKPNDELYIQINSLDDPTASIFSVANSVQYMNIATIQPYGASLMAYTVDKEGYLLLPVIGRIEVQDKTTTQVSEAITKALANILSQPVVSVKLVNRYVSVLGEVLHPGHFAYSQDKLTIYDAIGFAGDITDYGNRKDVILTRNENGKNIRIPVNLSTSDVLASDYYYIRPNDIIYVKPLPKKFWNMRQFPYAVVISTITTAILLWSVIDQQ
jgi:polysaccharide biosynthesis/export protein